MSTPSILAVMAHPDDAEICLGGTLARFADSGFDVHIGLVSIPDCRETRLAEAERGAAILGATLHVIDAPDSLETWHVEDVPVYKLVRALDNLQKKVSATTIFTHWIGDSHYDHVLVSRASLSMARRLALNIYMCEQPNQYAPSAFQMNLNTYVDVSRYIDRRIESMRAHSSQMTNRTYEEHVRTRSRYHGERLGCNYAEAFQCVCQQLEIGPRGTD